MTMDRRLTRWILTAGLCASAVGCTAWPISPKSAAPLVPFETLYHQWAPNNLPELQQQAEGERWEFRVDAMPLPALLMWMAQRSGQTVVWDQGLDNQTVSLAVRGQPFAEVLQLVARRLSVDVAQVGAAWWVGNLREEDQAVLVRRCRRLPADEAADVIGSVVSSGTSSNVFVAGDGLVVVVDRVPVVRKVAALLEQLEAVESVTWVTQLWIVSVTANDLRDLGLDVIPAVSAAAVLAGTAGQSSLLSAAADGAAISGQVKLDAVARAISRGEVGKLVADPLVLLVDGSEAKLSRGTRIPIRQTVVNTQPGATVENSRVQTINAGVDVTIGAREIDDARCRLALRVEVSELEAFRDGLPQIRAEEFESLADVQSGAVYLLGQLKRERESSSWSHLLQVGRKFERESTTLQVWGRVYRIGGPALRPPGRSLDGRGGVPLGGAPAAVENFEFSRPVVGCEFD